MIIYDLDYKNITKDNINFIFSSFGVPNITAEIGVYAGGTTFWLVENEQYQPFLQHHYCIDPFESSDDVGEDLSDVYQVFLQRLNECRLSEKISVIKTKSFTGLVHLHQENIRPQFVYIDGDHKASTVLQDLVLSFELIPVGGVILCDDVIWKYNKSDAVQMNPRMAVEMFLACNWQRLDILCLPHGGQTAFRKIQ